MSFYTSLIYFRPQPPPRITTRDLASVIKAIYSTTNVSFDSISGVHVKFGSAIDTDTKGTSENIEVIPGVAYQPTDIEFDIDHDAQTCEGMIAELMQSDSIVYRAKIHLGCAKDSICKEFQRMNSPENKVNLALHDLSLYVEPIHAYNLREDEPRHVGWIGLTLSGGGYMFPWTREDVLKRAEQSVELQQLAQIVNDAWPIDPHPLKRITNVRNLLARTRKALGAKDVNTLTAWQWDVNETG